MRWSQARINHIPSERFAHVTSIYKRDCEIFAESCYPVTNCILKAFWCGANELHIANLCFYVYCRIKHSFIPTKSFKIYHITRMNLKSLKVWMFVTRYATLTQPIWLKFGRCQLPLYSGWSSGWSQFSICSYISNLSKLDVCLLGRAHCFTLFMNALLFDSSESCLRVFKFRCFHDRYLLSFANVAELGRPRCPLFWLRAPR